MLENQFDLEPHGINTTKRLTVQTAEDILYKPFQCLDHGFVRLVDYMGGNEGIVRAARVSYGKGTKKVSEDEGLIRYLMRHRHTTPFEMVELTFHAKMPIFVARQWIRHRTANVNEISGRYSILDNEFYVPSPENLGVQSKTNRQGRQENSVTPEQANEVMELIKSESLRDYSNYESLLNEDANNPGKPQDSSKPMIARELARMGLGVNFYTQWYWKIDLHNLFHFLSLRMDKHAQYEIRTYADKMAEITKAVAPIAYKAFEDYRLNGMNLSRYEVDAIGKLVRGEKIESLKGTFPTKREAEEFTEKWTKLTSDHLS